MYQGGIKEITLYENKGITFYFYDTLNDRNITDLSGQGTIIVVENEQRPELSETEISLAESGRLTTDYLISFYLYGNNQDTDNTIEQLHDSIYGWCPLITYYDGTSKFYNAPFFLNPTKANLQLEMAFKNELKPRTGTIIKYLDYTPGISTVVTYRADTTLLRADTTIYTADYAF